MSASKEVRKVVEEFTGGQKMFTSVDVANTVKRTYSWRRNRDVAAELRNLFSTGDSLFDGYDRCVIAVDGGAKNATLYLPCGSDPDDYKERDQRADRPNAKAAPVQSQAPAQQPASPAKARAVASGSIKRVPRSMMTQQTDQSDIADVLATNIVMTKVIKTKERIKIPGEMIRKLGWMPGQPADLSRIKTHKAVAVGVVVSKDYRVSIPRKAVDFGSGPVKVILTSANDIVFDKA